MCAGSVLTRERLKTLTRLGIQIGISCDGPPEINDINRGSGKAVVRAMKMMKKEGQNSSSS